MNEITLGQIATAVAFLVALFTGFGYLSKQMKTWLTKALKDQFDPINKKIDNLESQVNKVDVESCKNFLVQFLSDVEKGVQMDEIQRERFWEEYQHYTEKGGNSYIHRKVEQLKSEQRL